MTAVRLTPAQVWAHGRFRAFAFIFGADIAAETLWLVTLGWLASSASSPLLTGLILCTGALPGIALTAGGGLLTDRYGPATLAAATLLLRLVVYLPWAIAFHHPSLLLVAGTALVLGGVSALHDPPMATYPIALLPREGQASAATIERIIGRAAQAAGAAAGGYLLGVAGVPAAGIAAVALTAAALLGLIWLGAHRRHDVAAAAPSPPPDVGRWLDGYRYVRGHPVLRYTVVIQGSVNLVTSAALTALLPLMARHHHWRPTGYGVALACYGAGMLVGLLFALRLTHRSTAARLSIAAAGALAASLLVAALAVSSAAAAAAVIAAAIGLTLGPVGPILSGYARTVADDIVVGRVMAVILTVTFVIEPVGWLILGALADISSLAAAGVTFGCVSAVVIATAGLRARSSHPSHA